MRTINNTFRFWLQDNDYGDILELIDKILSDWQKCGNKQRRNWWNILAGDKNGKSRVISGYEIPVLRAAQIRKGVKISENAICRNEFEKPPFPINANNRWRIKKNI